MQGKNAGRARTADRLERPTGRTAGGGLASVETGRRGGPSSPPGGLGAVVPPAEEETPQPAEPAAEAGRPVPSFFFQQAPLPQYFRDFLEDGWEADYRSVMEALYRGRSTVRRRRSPQRRSGNSCAARCSSLFLPAPSCMTPITTRARAPSPLTGNGPADHPLWLGAGAPLRGRAGGVSGGR